MKIGIVTPAPPGSRHGNRITALRWAGMLRSLGHRVAVNQGYEGESYDLLIALHALRSHDAIKRFHSEHPDRPLMVALTGTDLYRDIPKLKGAQQSLELASRLIVLQPKAFDALPDRFHAKTRVVYQSVKPFAQTRNPRVSTRNFQVCVIGHLREIKDPFRAAVAARLLPASSRVRIIHVGGAMNEKMAERARREMEINPRYRWIGDQPRWRVRQILMRSQL
jgi:glycosyltransferase involved in cell wall biosynthesis